ncbi:Lipopolysaccharide-assembly [Desulfonatronum thiosulfatophilum]|uniref:Lipopolysaccharide-assembly n=1 Tax=Desulfonatronum thiosulfatophilum TaxID=617002 RepID=A0A1G6AH68_9BACT|nr:LPS assembly lipoprotein LptE [Desulfonatronum thiosulfatophilum]SDB07762.1 Lipopolysaccharide-assembly [Desulfonatronum thiosulfatophilum]
MLRTLFIPAIGLLLFVAGCGYHFSASAPINLPQNVTNIYIQDVDNPTLEAWIDPYLRARFRDEFTRRARINWVDGEAAQAAVTLRIIAYYTDTELSGARDQTLRERATVTMETEFRSMVDGSLIWSSGRITEHETFEAGTSDIAAGQRALENAIRRTADGLGADY